MSKRSKSVATRLIVVLAGGIAILLTAVALGLSNYLSERLESKANESLQLANRQIIDMIDAYNQAIKGEIRRLNRIFASHYPNSFSRSDQGTLLHGGTPITQDSTSAPDHFTALTGAYATVLTRKGSDFERTTTSIKDDKGLRASGVLLGAGHPAVARLLQGESYTGKARMFGRDVMTHYQPILDSQGTVIGALFTGIDFSDGLAELRKKVLAVKIGLTGYPYALDNGNNKGLLTLHPKIEGQSLLETKGARGENFVKTMLDTKNGVTRYWWQNPNESEAREKIVVFNEYPEWNWVIASGSYLEEFNAESRQTTFILLASILLLIPMIVLALWWTIRRWISRPLDGVVGIASRIAAGDFTSRIESDRQDEIGHLTRAFATMQHELACLLREVRETADHVSTGTCQMQSSAQGVAASSQEQSDAITSMAASVEQMSSSITLIAENACHAEKIAHASVSAAQESSDIMDHAVAAMGRIADSVRETAGTVEALGQQSASISSIAGTIKEIADQTNLLALNAAIEAARAGEAGRGFAVVADEVRKLAERTTRSTHEISELIDSIQAGTQEAVDRMNRGVDEVSKGVQLAANANTSIQRIRHGASEVSQAVAGITEAIHEQSAASQTVASGIEQIACGIEQNSNEAHSTASTAEKLQLLAQQLHLGVQRFQT